MMESTYCKIGTKLKSYIKGLSTMFYTSLTLSGFGRYKTKTRWDFKGGITIIDGDNGSGKTTISDAIQWALYGPAKSIRSTKERTSVINRNSQSAKVVLSLVTEEGENMTITRKLSRKEGSANGSHSLTVDVDGEKTTKITDGQNLINDVLMGLTPEVFAAASMMNSSPTSPVNLFVSSTPKDRRAILSGIADPAGEYAKLYKSVTKQLKAKRDELKKMEGELDGLQTALDKQVKPEGEPGDIDDISQRLKDVNKAISDINVNYDTQQSMEKRESLEKDIDRLHSELVKLRKKSSSEKNRLRHLEEDEEEAEQQLLSSERKIKSLNKEIDEKSVELELAEKLYAVNMSRVEKLSEFVEVNNAARTSARLIQELNDARGTCIVCGNPIDKNHSHDGFTIPDVYDESYAKRVLSSRFQSAILEDNKKRLNEEVTRIDRALNKEDSLLSSLDRRIESIEEDIKETRSYISDYNKEIPQLEEEIKALEERLKTFSGEESSEESSRRLFELQEDKKALDEELNKARALHSELESYHKSVSLLLDEIEDQKTRVKTQINVVKVVENLRTQASPQGDISTSILSLSDEISGLANAIYENGFSRDANISIVAESEDDEPTCVIYVDGRDLATYSHGEQSRIISALLLALAKTVQNNLGLWIPLLWDEPSLSIDNDEEDIFLSMIPQVTENQEQSFVITRNKYDPDYVDNEIHLSV